MTEEEFIKKISRSVIRSLSQSAFSRHGGWKQTGVQIPVGASENAPMGAFFVLVPSSAGKRLQGEVEKARKQAAQLEISPEALTLALETWQRQIIKAQEQENVHALRDLLKNFVSKIQLGYTKAVVWYTYPLEENGINSNANSHKKPLSLGAKSLVLEWS